MTDRDTCVFCGADVSDLRRQVCAECEKRGGPPMKTILSMDPGESTGWVYRDRLGNLTGGTAGKNHEEVAQLIYDLRPDIMVFERFNLYPALAKSLAWNSFYPCETIGVIRYMCSKLGIPIVEQAPGIKKYYGGTKADWDEVKATGHRVTEHTKDAYMHYRYFLLNGIKKFQ